LEIWKTVVESVQRLSTARPGYVLAALGLYVVSLFIVGTRWRGFLRTTGSEVGVWRATLATLCGIAVGNLFPASRVGGEACRIGLVRQSGAVTWRQATVAAVWDRLSEIPAILVLVVMAAVAVKNLASTWRTLAVLGGIAVALVGGGLALRNLRRSGSGLAGWRARLAIDEVDVRVFALAVGLSALLWLQDVLRLACVSLAFGVSLSATQIATLSMVAMVAGLVPSIVGLGPVEGGLVTGLVAFGVDVPTAAAIMAAERLISYGFSTAAGSVVVALLGGRSLWKAARGRSAPPDPMTTCRR
jgi:uncharacterized membrane protein YbhN (UPF0104 family)